MKAALRAKAYIPPANPRQGDRPPHSKGGKSCDPLTPSNVLFAAYAGGTGKPQDLAGPGADLSRPPSPDVVVVTGSSHSNRGSGVATTAVVPVGPPTSFPRPLNSASGSVLSGVTADSFEGSGTLGRLDPRPVFASQTSVAGAGQAGTSIPSGVYGHGLIRPPCIQPVWGGQSWTGLPLPATSTPAGVQGMQALTRPPALSVSAAQPVGYQPTSLLSPYTQNPPALAARPGMSGTGMYGPPLAPHYPPPPSLGLVQPPAPYGAQWTVDAYGRQVPYYPPQASWYPPGYPAMPPLQPQWGAPRPRLPDPPSIDVDRGSVEAPSPSPPLLLPIPEASAFGYSQDQDAPSRAAAVGRLSAPSSVVDDAEDSGPPGPLRPSDMLNAVLELTPDAVHVSQKEVASHATMSRHLPASAPASQIVTLKESDLLVFTLQDINERLNGRNPRADPDAPLSTVTGEMVALAPATGTYLPPEQSAAKPQSFPFSYETLPDKITPISGFDLEVAEVEKTTQLPPHLPLTSKVLSEIEESARRGLVSASMLDSFLGALVVALREPTDEPQKTPFDLRRSIDVDYVEALLLASRTSLEDVFRHLGTEYGNAILFRRDMLLSAPSCKLREAGKRLVRALPLDSAALVGARGAALTGHSKTQQRDEALYDQLVGKLSQPQKGGQTQKSSQQKTSAPKQPAAPPAPKKPRRESQAVKPSAGSTQRRRDRGKPKGGAKTGYPQ